MDGHRCGYAPRALCRLSRGSEEVLFVGCKDGSVTVLLGAGEAWEVTRLPLQIDDRPRAPIRVLLTWGDHKLLVGRDDGSLDAIDWLAAIVPAAAAQYQPNRVVVPKKKDSLRYVAWVGRNQRHLLVSFREQGTILFSVGAKEDLAEGDSLAASWKDLGGIRLAAQIEDDGPLVLLDHACNLWRWSCEGGSVLEKPERIEGDWPELPRGRFGKATPATLDDVTYVGPVDDQDPSLKKIQAILMATDLGLFALDLRQKSWSGGAQAKPLPVLLPGLPEFCMAVTCVLTDSGAQLWVADRRGEVLLFENSAPLGKADLAGWLAGFRRSRALQLDSQALIGVSWPAADASWLALACRDDMVRILRQPAQGVDRASAQLLDERIEATAEGRQAFLSRMLACFEEPPPADWPPFAVFARFLEHCAETSPAGFSDYLLDPRVEAPLAILALEAERHSENLSARDQSLLQAPKHWVFCLTGLVHGLTERKQQGYLGIIRFFKNLEQAIGNLELAGGRSPELLASLQGAIKEAIDFARKWGIYGEANEIRQDLVNPLKLLGKFPARNRLYDRLTYSSVLFRRSYSERGKVVKRRLLPDEHPGENAWILRRISLASEAGKPSPGHLIGVSWRLRAIQLYRLNESGGSASLAPVALDPSLKNEELPSFARLGTVQSDYSRDFLLLARPGVGERFFLLHARRTGSESQWEKDLECWPCRLVEGGLRLETEGEAKRLLSTGRSGGSAYRMLELDEPKDLKKFWTIAIGLEGEDGEASVAVLEVSAAGDLNVLEKKDPIHLRSSQSDRGFGERSEDTRSFRNRTWSLAKAGDGGFVAGTDNGEIWFVDAAGEPLLVGKIGSAVVALAARRLPADSNDPDGERNLRVFAGSRDGTLIGFQRLPIGEEKNSKGTPHSVFVTLWATVEEAQIIHLACVEYHRANEDFDLVLAVTQHGSILAIDDCDKMVGQKNGLANGAPISRPAFPGTRWMRSSLHRPCYSAAVFPFEENFEAGQWCRLAITSDAAEVELVSLHYPRYTVPRKHEFRRHFGDLGRILAPDTTTAAVRGRDIRPEYLRALDGISKPAPLLPLLIVRSLLEYHWRKHCAAVRPRKYAPYVRQIRELPQYWLPQSLRPLHGIVKSWDLALQGDAAAVGAVGDGLREALDLAVKRRDVDLYQEICTLILKRTNFLILDGTRLEDKPVLVWELYCKIFDTIEGSLQSWTGSPGHAERRVRIVVAKNMVDGPAAHKVFRLLDQERDRPGPRFDALDSLLNKRIEGVRQLVWKGDPVVSIESLRAANHSLLRIANLLCAARRQDQDFTAIRWRFFRRYFRRLVFGAAQALGPNLRSKDALSHEYARTFALCLCIAPEGVVKMTAQLSEIGLFVDPRREDDLSARIAWQCKLLEQTFGLEFHPYSKGLFPEVLLKPDSYLPGVPNFARTKPWHDEPMNEIKKDLDKVGELYQFVQQIREVESRLAEGKGNDYLKPLVAASKKARGEAEGGILGEDLFRHSWRFWRSAFGGDPADSGKGTSSLGPPDRAFLTELGNLSKLDAPAGSGVRPQAVLFSLNLAAWAKSQRDNLSVLYRQSRIFAPEYQLFTDVLDGLERAADGFPQSAGVQKNLVVGLLGHHLLEALDLHVLDLREIARNLEPRPEFLGANPTDDAGHSGKASKSLGLESRFAARLNERAKKSRGLPKTLRALTKVLQPEISADPKDGDSSSSGRDVPEGKLGVRLDQLVVEIAKGWNCTGVEAVGRPVSARESELLALVFDELRQNQRHHSGFPESKAEIALTKEALVLKFPVKDRGWDRLKTLTEHEAGQQLVDPNPSPHVVSSGAGLYICGLAAAMIRWSMKLEAVIDPVTTSKTLKVTLTPPTQEKDDIDISTKIFKDRKSITPCWSKVDVVVIDDKWEVAQYVWREIGNIPGFSGDQPRFLDTKAVSTPDERFRVWWIPAKAGWQDVLDAASKKLIDDRNSRFFLVDVRGPVAGATSGAYKCEQVVKYLEKKFEDDQDRIWLISAYEHGRRLFGEGGRELRILDKGPDTFSNIVRLANRGFAAARAKRSSPSLVLESDWDSAIHVLITGAGFEFQPREGEGEALGLPGTKSLIESWVKRVFRSVASRGKKKEGFAIARAMQDNLKFESWILSWLQKHAGSYLRSPPLPSASTTVDRHPLILTQWDLDEYWNETIAAIWSANLKGKVKDEATVKAWLEQYFREEFRKAFLGSDWGYLPQARAAADLEWKAWLSTNYTRFANRSIEKVAPRDWRAIEISDEAADFNRQMLFGLPSTELRYLFKLHGDIGHALTMAISGKDKTITTGLNSFSQLYLAAQKFLQLASENPDQKIVWHIVGHGLKDELLVQVIKQVCQAKKGRDALRFVVVDPGTDSHPVQILYDHLKDIDSDPNHFIGLRCTATRYMTRLRELGTHPRNYRQVIDDPDTSSLKTLPS